MRLPLHQRLIALLLMLAYASTSTAALPAMIGWVAAIEGSHTVQVTKSVTGMQITLHHAGGDFTPKIADHRSALARVMVSLCTASASGDHRLDAAQLNDGPNASRERLVNPSSGTRLAVEWTVFPCETLPLALSLRQYAVLKARQAPDDRCLKQERLATVQLLV